MFSRLLQLVGYFYLDYLKWSQTTANITLQKNVLVGEEKLIAALYICVLNHNLL